MSYLTTYCGQPVRVSVLVCSGVSHVVGLPAGPRFSDLSDLHALRSLEIRRAMDGWDRLLADIEAADHVPQEAANPEDLVEDPERWDGMW